MGVSRKFVHRHLIIVATMLMPPFAAVAEPLTGIGALQLLAGQNFKLRVAMRYMDTVNLAAMDLHGPQLNSASIHMLNLKSAPAQQFELKAKSFALRYVGSKLSVRNVQPLKKNPLELFGSEIKTSGATYR